MHCSTSLSQSIFGSFRPLQTLLALSLLTAFVLFYAMPTLAISKTQKSFPKELLAKSKTHTKAHSKHAALWESSSEQQRQFINFTDSKMQHLLVINHLSDFDSEARTREQSNSLGRLTTGISRSSWITETQDSENFSKRRISITARLSSVEKRAKSLTTFASLPEINLKTSTTVLSKQSFKPLRSGQEIGRTSARSHRQNLSWRELLQSSTRERLRYAARSTAKSYGLALHRKPLNDLTNLNRANSRQRCTNPLWAKQFQKTPLIS